MLSKFINKFSDPLNLKHDQQGIIKRYLNEKDAWESHLKNCRNFIEQQTIKTNKNEVWVLGSGWLLDVPIEFLSKKFNKVVLIDIHHPAQVLRKIKKFENIEARVVDVTGTITIDLNDIIKKRKRKDNTLPEISNYLSNIIPDNAFVISLNLLSQLNTLYSEPMEQSGLFRKSEILSFVMLLQSAHIASLPLGASIIISDHTEHVNKSGKLLASNPLVYCNFPKAILSEQWQWNFDSKGNYHVACNVLFEVIAIYF